MATPETEFLAVGVLRALGDPLAYWPHTASPAVLCREKLEAKVLLLALRDPGFNLRDLFPRGMVFQRLEEGTLLVLREDGNLGLMGHGPELPVVIHLTA